MKFLKNPSYPQDGYAEKYQLPAGFVFVVLYLSTKVDRKNIYFHLVFSEVYISDVFSFSGFFKSRQKFFRYASEINGHRPSPIINSMTLEEILMALIISQSFSPNSLDNSIPVGEG